MYLREHSGNRSWVHFGSIELEKTVVWGPSVNGGQKWECPEDTNFMILLRLRDPSCGLERGCRERLKGFRSWVRALRNSITLMREDQGERGEGIARDIGGRRGGLYVLITSCRDTVCSAQCPTVYNAQCPTVCNAQCPNFAVHSVPQFAWESLGLDHRSIGAQ